MERITIKELAARLNDVEASILTGSNISEVLLLEDTIFGLENGIYRTFGELQLPVQYANCQPDDYRSYELFTLLTHNFFDGIISRNAKGKPASFGSDALRKIPDEKLYIYEEGFSDATSAKKVTQGFLEQFFKQYQDLAKVTDEEARECLQRSFIKYQVEGKENGK